jgi:acylphosphatase
MQTVVAIVFGRVQGVFFRVNVKKIAKSMGVLGCVENLDDGSVRILAQGSRQLLEEFLRQVKASPGMSEVERIETRWKKSAKPFHQFEVIHT